MSSLASFGAKSEQEFSAPDPIDLLDRISGRKDLPAVSQAARAAMVPLDSLGVPLAHVFGTTSLKPTVAEVCAVFTKVVDILDGSPDSSHVAARLASISAVVAQEEVVESLGRELSVLLRGRAIPFEQLADADDAAESLRGRGFEDIDAVRAFSLSTRGEHAERAEILASWGAILSRLGFSGIVAPSDELRNAATTITMIGADWLFWARRMPENAFDVVSSFVSRLKAAVSGRDTLVALHGEGWLSNSSSRLRNAAGVIEKEDSLRLDVALDFAASVAPGVYSEREIELRTMADVIDAIRSIEGDTGAASILGPAYRGLESDVRPVLAALETWNFLRVAARGVGDLGLLARVLVEQSLGDAASMITLVSTTVDLERGFSSLRGCDWSASVADVAVADVVDGLVARIEPVCASGDAFGTVSCAFRLSARLERARRVLDDLRAAVPSDPAVLARCRRIELETELSVMFGGERFQIPDDSLLDLLRVCREAEVGAASFRDNVSALCDLLAFEVIGYETLFCDAADILRFLEASPLLVQAMNRKAVASWSNITPRLLESDDKARSVEPKIPDVEIGNSCEWVES